MKIKNLIAVAASAAVLALGSSAKAVVTFGYSNTGNSAIQFNGDGTFTFTPAVNNFSVTTGSALNLPGEITGVYTIGAVTSDGVTSSAPVTGVGTFVIHDGANDLTATLQWVDITQDGTAGFLNVGGSVNLTGITYSGSNPDLVALKAAGSAINVFNFQFTTVVPLAALTAGPFSTTFAGTVFADNPPPCSCVVTFTSPSTLNLNAGDVIPPVTATEDCGNGPTPVTVTLLGASTNGTCPQIITLTNGATDDCGDIITNIQTITVQCPPPPCSCTLTFTTPPAITLCAGDTIPAVTASENCGNGLTTSVAVQFLGAVTNGSCPKIITRTNSAMDNCGNFQTNIQTITVNCRGNICGHIFADCDGSGDLTAGDVGLSNVVVTLISSNNVVLGTVKTDANGGYCFTNLAGGNYTVSVAAPTGYSQTAATTSYHWKDSYGRICWQENDGYIHCLSSGTECWWDKSNCSHWKDSYGRDCWKDNYGNTHCQPCGYQTCNATTYNNKITVSLTNCTSKTDVDFAYTGSKSSVSVTCSAPSYVKCGQSYTYTCTVVNNGNVCFTGGKVCHTIGNCNNWGGWSNCTTITDNCPPLSPGQKCTFTHKCNTSYGNNGTITCQANVSCYSSKSGNCSGQNSCNAQCGW